MRARVQRISLSFTSRKIAIDEHVRHVKTLTNGRQLLALCNFPNNAFYFVLATITIRLTTSNKCNEAYLKFN